MMCSICNGHGCDYCDNTGKEVKTCDVLVTDPSQRGTLEHNDELIIFACSGSDDLDYILHDGYKLYINGVLAVRQVAEQLFNKEIE